MKLSLYLARATPPVLISLLALLVALSGTALAVNQGSGNALVKRASLSGNRIKPDSVTGRQVQESTLSKVPRAGQADTATSLPRPEVLVLTLDDGVDDAAATTGRAGVTVDLEGYAHLEGAVATTAAGRDIATLPASARPGHRVVVAVATVGAAPGRIGIDPDGTVALLSGDPSFVSLEGVVFRTATP